MHSRFVHWSFIATLAFSLSACDGGLDDMETGKAEQSRLDTEYMQKPEADLRKEWGSSYDENVAFANDYLSKSPDLVKLELRDGSLLGSHPQFVRQMAVVGRMANEGQLKFGISGTEMATDTKVQYDQLARHPHSLPIR